MNRERSRSSPQPTATPAGEAPVAASRALLPRRLCSRDLVGPDGQVEIEHDGAVYRLRVTSLGKLILTK